CFGDPKFSFGNITTGQPFTENTALDEVKLAAIEGRYPKKFCQQCIRFGEYPQSFALQWTLQKYQAFFGSVPQDFYERLLRKASDPSTFALAEPMPPPRPGAGVSRGVE